MIAALPRILPLAAALCLSACASTVVERGDGEYYGHEEAVPLREPSYSDWRWRQSECEQAAWMRYPRRMERRCITRRRGKEEVRECAPSGYDINQSLRYDYVERCMHGYGRY